MSGKGSKPRPYSVTQDEFSNNWDIIFGNKDKKQDKIILNKDNNHSHKKLLNTQTHRRSKCQT